MFFIWHLFYFVTLVTVIQAWIEFKELDDWKEDLPIVLAPYVEPIPYVVAKEGSGDPVIGVLRCGCGRPVRYLIRKNGVPSLSCNKYRKCPVPS